jgi:hypothetical protein
MTCRVRQPESLTNPLGDKGRMPVGTGRAYPDSSSAKIALCFTCRRCDLIFASTPIDLNVFAEHKVGNRAHTRL